MRIGILNATGYSGAELVRFLSGHPDFEISGVTARSQVGKRLGEIFPWVRAGGRPSYANLQLHEDLEETPDIVISCLPHKASAQRLAPFLERGIRTKLRLYALRPRHHSCAGSGGTGGSAIWSCNG